MTDRDKPLLLEVADAQDTETFEAELEWYFNCYDSKCGLRSLGSAGLEAAFDSDGNRHVSRSSDPETVRLKASHHTPLSDPWGTPGHLIAFRKGREVWSKITQVSWVDQETIRRHYEPLQPRLAGQDWGLPKPDRKRVVEAIRHYRGVY